VRTLHPRDGQAHGIRHATVSRVCRAFGLQPHWTETFTLSEAPFLIPNVPDIVTLYPDPPDRARAMVDDGLAASNTDRTAPFLPAAHRRHRVVEFRPFLDRIDAKLPADLERHIQAPTSGWSGLNLVERGFGELTTKWLPRGAHRRVSETRGAAWAFTDWRNDEPKPFV
jgi:hypothetical protein